MTDLTVASTSAEEITITWTNPSPAPVEVKVAFDDHEIPVDDPAITEYTFTESASDVPFTPDQSGKCKVITVVASGDCADTENEVEIDCTASDAPGKKPIILLTSTVISGSISSSITWTGDICIRVFSRHF